MNDRRLTSFTINGSLTICLRTRAIFMRMDIFVVRILEVLENELLVLTLLGDVVMEVYEQGIRNRISVLQPILSFCLYKTVSSMDDLVIW